MILLCRLLTIRLFELLLLSKLLIFTFDIKRKEKERKRETCIDLVPKIYQ